MNVTWTSRKGAERQIKSPIAKFLILSLLWLPLIAICFLIHVPIWLVNGRGFHNRRDRSFEPPPWATLIALIIYATVLVWAVVQVA